MLIEKRFAGFKSHTKLMLTYAIDKSPRVIGSSFGIYAQYQIGHKDSISFAILQVLKKWGTFYRLPWPD